jgi:ribonuclease E
VDEPRAVIAAQVETAEPVIAAEAEPVPAALAEAQPEPTPAPVPAPVVTAAPPAPVAVAPAPAAVHAPFVLPTEQLQSVAESAGLQWVNSDAEKIRAVQEAMAREPKPVHVPREPKPLQAVDEGPLVLVETRKDLSQIKLPFETAQGGGSQPQA